eukprot:CAMPEP_0181425514 /NCGR_PEP_ID=MMETSP1110-20121109/15197_1 /TAXON_ID=174948 /ORGANISM="Symbiodinium sp., Strain CCMP421" /LENGTH=318 /DNA_ID=CAMNT_0023548701 /DNA_START=263 /DNA_END=1219 /DNA_ORIENTATION=-
MAYAGPMYLTGCRTPDAPMFQRAAFSDGDSPGSQTPTEVAFPNLGQLQEKLKDLEVKGKLESEKLAPLYVLQSTFQDIKPRTPFTVGPLPLRSEVKEEEGVPAPPLPHATARPEKAAGQSHVISAGSVGHPFNCAEACKYVKRKGGCRDGANCTKCHECFWSRMPAQGVEEERKKPEMVIPEQQPFSAGSLGHPYTCSSACKYVWRKRGCRDGANCPNCHYCKWQRQPKEEEEEQETIKEAAPIAPALLNIPPPPGLTPMSPWEQSELRSSVGSSGHPFSCAPACKYVGKASGCMDGTNCPNCHLCRWSRSNLKVFHL